MWQLLQYVAQPRIRLLAVDFGGLDQAVDLSTGGGALGRVAEQPRLAPDDKRFYRSLGRLLSIGKKPASTYRSSRLQLLAR
jgi:hypothetical protein